MLKIPRVQSMRNMFWGEYEICVQLQTKKYAAKMQSQILCEVVHSETALLLNLDRRLALSILLLLLLVAPTFVASTRSFDQSTRDLFLHHRSFYLHIYMQCKKITLLADRFGRVITFGIRSFKNAWYLGAQPLLSTLK